MQSLLVSRFAKRIDSVLSCVLNFLPNTVLVHVTFSRTNKSEPTSSCLPLLFHLLLYFFNTHYTVDLINIGHAYKELTLIDECKMEKVIIKDCIRKTYLSWL